MESAPKRNSWVNWLRPRDCSSSTWQGSLEEVQEKLAALELLVTPLALVSMTEMKAAWANTLPTSMNLKIWILQESMPWPIPITNPKLHGRRYLLAYWKFVLILQRNSCRKLIQLWVLLARHVWAKKTSAPCLEEVEIYPPVQVQLRKWRQI